VTDRLTSDHTMINALLIGLRWYARVGSSVASQITFYNCIRYSPWLWAIAVV